MNNIKYKGLLDDTAWMGMRRRSGEPACGAWRLESGKWKVRKRKGERGGK
jgi:hypothetical protein